MLLFCSVQARQYLCNTVCGSISKGVIIVSHCPLHVDYYLKEFAIIAITNACIEHVTDAS